MIHYTGFYYCTMSNWDNEWFDVTNLVSTERKSEDYDNLIDSKYDINLEEENIFRRQIRYCELKPEVFLWLEENVKDQQNGLKGWCCGNKEYNTGSHEGFSLFFYRRKDAQNFIRTWSVHKKPTETYNQNTYVNKVLDKTTNTLKVVKKK